MNLAEIIKSIFFGRQVEEVERLPKFYSYENKWGLFLGDSPEEIIETLQFYHDTEDENVYVPSKSEIKREQDLEFDWAYVNMSLIPQHYVEVDICEGMRFNVYPNKFDEFVDFVTNARAKYARGSLFKSRPQNKCSWVFFPESVVQAMENYDWEQHRGEMENALSDQHECMAKLYTHPNIATHDDQGRVVRYIPIIGVGSTEVH